MSSPSPPPAHRLPPVVNSSAEPHVVPAPDGSALPPERQSALRRVRSLTTGGPLRGTATRPPRPTVQTTASLPLPTAPNLSDLSPIAASPLSATGEHPLYIATPPLRDSATRSPVCGTTASPPGTTDAPTTYVPPPASASARWELPDIKDQQGRLRRNSVDAKASQERYFFIDVAETERRILEQEDTNGDFQITILDGGPKTLKLGSAESHGFNKYDLRGTYVLSNLLQELALAKDLGKQFIVLPESKLTENPVHRLSRMIATSFWAGLTRTMDRKGMHIICQDPKNRSHDQSLKIYVPYEDHVAQAYYRNVVETTAWGLQLHVLPPDISPEYVKTLDEHPGILSLALHKTYDPLARAEIWRGVPFVVPGGRFNEMYGWDSYFETLGLLVDDKVDLGKHMVDNFCYQIHHYGKILNANRTYYLTRSQPPFLTDMARKVHAYQAPPHAAESGSHHHGPIPTAPVIRDDAWLLRVLLFAIKEYYTVWMAAPRIDIATGLSAYHPTGIGMPPETEATHFLHVLAPYARKHGVSVEEFQLLYNSRAVNEPELDAYFLHDRAVRESGHDTTYRLEHRCASLLTVDLNALLHKYEADIADLIDQVGVTRADGSKAVPVPTAWWQSSALPTLDEHADVAALCANAVADLARDVPAHLYTPDHAHTSVPVPLRPTDALHWSTSAVWRHRAARRRATMTRLMWDDVHGEFFDWDMAANARSAYHSVTTLWALWAHVATRAQADKMVEVALPKYEMLGGLVSGTEASRGAVSLDRPNRQWDYPFGWAPHQIMAWHGLKEYGFDEVAERLAYRWLYTITKAFVDFNGTVPEKFDVVTLNHILKVEYGNVGTDFKYVPREGFGWMNASYQVGLTYLQPGTKRKLGVVSPPDMAFRAASPTKDNNAARPAASAGMMARAAWEEHTAPATAAAPMVEAATAAMAAITIQ
ncbi:alpha,alpha-trehalase nth1 [Allomyces javanicus]|nr:alpha,alpha-trehalase nth1 [Allomyces javanicus]